MDTRRLSVLCLVIVVGLAGCAGLSPFDGNQSGNSQGATETPGVSYPDGYSESGISDPEKAAKQDSSGLLGHDNLTIAMNGETELSDTPFTINITGYIDLKHKNMSMVAGGYSRSTKITNQSRYQNNNTGYAVNGTLLTGPQYTVSKQPFPDITSSADTGMASEWLTNASFGEASQVTHNGETMFQYNITSVDSAKPFIIGSSATDPTVNEFNGTLTVDENGIVRSLTYTMNYTTADGTEKPMNVSYQATDLNSTTVEEPTWVKTARAQA